MKNTNPCLIRVKRSLIATAVAGVIGLSVTTTAAEAASLSSLAITSGTFTMGAFTPVPNIITNFSGANLIGAYNPATWDENLTQTGPASGAVMAWDFNGISGVWFNAFTAASGGPAPSGDVTGTTLTLDLSALFNNVYGRSHSQGGFVTGIASGGTSGTFTASWTSIFYGGAFPGQTGTYNVSGTYAAVPVPAAAWLMGSGLAGLAGLARRRRKPHGST